MVNQVLTIEQMQELIELGIDTSKATFYWYGTDETEFVCFGTDMDKDCGDEICPTFTLQDILEMLPKGIDVANTRTDKEEYIGINYLRIGYPTMLDRLYIMYTKDMNMNSGWATFDAEESLLNAAFEMLKWCKVNQYF